MGADSSFPIPEKELTAGSVNLAVTKAREVTGPRREPAAVTLLKDMEVRCPRREPAVVILLSEHDIKLSLKCQRSGKTGQKVFSGHERTPALVSSQQLGLPAQDLHRIKSPRQYRWTGPSSEMLAVVDARGRRVSVLVVWVVLVFPSETSFRASYLFICVPFLNEEMQKKS